jgi:hypothetical protein
MTMTCSTSPTVRQTTYDEAQLPPAMAQRSPTDAGVLDMEQRCVTHLHGGAFSDSTATAWARLQPGRQAAWSADGRSFAVAGADGVRVLNFSPGCRSPCAVGRSLHAPVLAAVHTQLHAVSGV